MRLFHLISSHGTKIIASAALLGLAAPVLAELLRPLIASLLVAMLCVSMLRVDLAALLGRLKHPRRTLAAATAITVACPLLVLSTLSATTGPLGSATGLAVAFLFVAPPPIVSAPAFALLMGLDGALVLSIMLISTVAMVLTVPIMAALFVGDALPVGASDLAGRLAVMICGACLTAAAIRRVVGPARIVAARPLLDAAGVAIAMLFAIGAMDTVGARLVAAPTATLAVAAAAFAMQGAQIVAFYGLFQPFVGADAVAIAYAAGNRNAGLVVAALGATQVGDTVWLFFALSQLPVFTFPLLLAPLGRRLVAAHAAPLSRTKKGTMPQ
ncbi:hypothetical protein [Acuticoccus sp.]|uniref:hypothetical protein n=1 Tax=Acuticoccus sp. TaxID=1904378 RepID=UPI003B524503